LRQNNKQRDCIETFSHPTVTSDAVTIISHCFCHMAQCQIEIWHFFKII